MNESTRTTHSPPGPFVISGYPRSGSTLLASILLQNPDFQASYSSPVAVLLNQLPNTAAYSPSFTIQHLRAKWALAACTLNIALVLSSWSVGAEERRYGNNNYGFSVSIPNHLVVCESKPPSPNHGATFLVTGRDCDLDATETRIVVFGAFNVAAEASNTAGLAPQICNNGLYHRTRFIMRSNNWLSCVGAARATLPYTSYFLLRRLPNTEPESWVYYEVDLYCKNDCDLTDRLAAKIIQSMEWFEPHA